MNICVAGWYYHEPLIATLGATSYISHIVAHRPPKIELHGLDFDLIPNIGLEFHCYNWYLQNKWTSGPVLFLHDDTEITPEALDTIANLKVDQAFLFSSNEEAKANGYAHGRAIFCSEKFLTQLKKDGGFWYDESLTPTAPIPPTVAGQPDYHNQGIQNFLAYVKDRPNANLTRIIPGLKTGYRGRLTPEPAKPVAPTGKKVNLCCGQTHYPGYINVDAYPLPGVDLVCDARDLNFDANSLDEVVLFHAIEHFSLDDACRLLRNIFRWLRPGGHLVVEGPDIVKAVKNCPSGDFETVKSIFGDLTELRQNKPGYQHLWGWTGSLLQQELSSAGFNVSKVENGLSHANMGWRDYRVVGFKPR